METVLKINKSSLIYRSTIISSLQVVSPDIKGTASPLHINSGIVFSLVLSPDNEQHQIPFLIQNWTNPWLSGEVDQMWERSNQHQEKGMRNIHPSVLGWIGKSELSEQHEAYIQLSKQFTFCPFQGMAAAFRAFKQQNLKCADSWYQSYKSRNSE